MSVEGSVLIGTEDRDPIVWRCARNIRGVDVLPVDQMNAYGLMVRGKILMTPEGLKRLVDRVGRKKTEEVSR